MPQLMLIDLLFLLFVSPAALSATMAGDPWYVRAVEMGWFALIMLSYLYLGVRDDWIKRYDPEAQKKACQKEVRAQKASSSDTRIL